MKPTRNPQLHLKHIAFAALVGVALFTAQIARGQVTFTQVTGDADSGIVDTDTYTHAIDFGNGAPPTVNGVPFVQDFGTAAGGIPNTGTRTYGPQSHGGNNPPAVTGSISDVFRDMRYDGPDGAHVELTGLTPGKTYEFRLYDRAWDHNGSIRPATLSFDIDADSTVEDTSLTYDTNRPQDAPMSLGGNVSFVTSYTYTAGSNGSLRVSIGIGGTGTYHIYGLTNVESGPDLTAPAIAELSPADDSTGAYPGANLVATFDEDIELTGGGTITLTDLTNASDTRAITLPDAGVTASGPELTIDLAAIVSSGNLEYSTEYEVTIDGAALEDLAETPNAYGGTTSGEWTFTTVAQDPTAPVINDKSPVDDAPGVTPDANIVATFDKNIVIGSGNITLVDVTDATGNQVIAVTDGTQVSVAGNVLTIDPAVNLEGASDYAVQIDAGAVENFSNVDFVGISDIMTWNFTVVDTTTITGTAGGDNSWNEAGNWDFGVPGGSLSAVIADGVAATVDGGNTVPYTGDLTIGVNSSLRVGWVNPRNAEDFNALGTPGSTTITMKDGSDMHFRAGDFAGNRVIPAIVLEGNASMRLNSSTEPAENFDFAHGINGPHTLTMRGKGNQDAIFSAPNSFGELVITSTEGSYDVFADAALSLNGDVTLEAAGTAPAAKLTIAADAISDTATLALNGSETGTLITVNGDDTVGFLTVNGGARPAGTYGATGLGGVDYEVDWLNGSGILTVNGASDPGALTADFAGTSAGGLTNVYVTEPVTYTITLSGPHSPALTASDLETASGTAFTVESFAQSPDFPAQYDVVVMADEPGSLQLQIKAGTVLTDLFGNTLTFPAADNDTFTIDALPSFDDGVGYWKPWWNSRINPATGAVWAEDDTLVGAFVTSGTRDATDAAIATYHSFVSTAAATQGWGAATWYCVGQSFNDPARDTNAPTMTTSHPIFLPNGAKLADDGPDLSNGPDITFSITELGTSYGGAVATGSNRKFGDPGQSNIENGVAWAADARWWQQYNGSKGGQWHFYALSEELTLTSSTTPPYGTWAGTFPGLTDTDPDLDFDSGGLDTGIEWVVGGDPTDPSDDAGLAPTIDNSDGSWFIYNYRRHDDAAADSNTVIKVQYSTDLSIWIDAVDNDTDVDIIEHDDDYDTNVDRVEVKFSRSTAAAGDEFFVRLVVTVTTP